MIKGITLFLLSWVTICTGFAQQKLPKVFGTVRIDSATLMAQAEVSIKEWMGFIANNDFDESLFPDTNAVTNTTKLLFNDLRKKPDFQYLKVVKNTLRYSGDKEVETANNYGRLIDTLTDYFSLALPVTGITFEQAQKFCKWKEMVIGQSEKEKVAVSLPSVEIYKKVIPNIDTLSKKCDCPVLNTSTAKNRTKDKGKQGATQGKGLENVHSYFPTPLGLYNIQGNAAEMTATYGIAMGGSFRQTARESYNDRSQKYSKPADWLGFRYIITKK